jgi:O-acetyl-ADP-ribose deacetylase (regulator of RNase III)
MKALHVIHTVGPIWKGGGSGESELLSMAYRNSLDKAESLGARSIAFPAISTGAYGYPVDKACWVAMEAVLDFLLKGNRNLKEIRFVLFSEGDYRVYGDALERLKMPVM